MMMFPAGPQRSSIYPDVPLLAELGINFIRGCLDTCYRQAYLEKWKINKRRDNVPI